MFPELPDANMDTLNPIVFSPNFYPTSSSKRISKMMAERARPVNEHSREKRCWPFEKA